jgi:FHA domain
MSVEPHGPEHAVGPGFAFERREPLGFTVVDVIDGDGVVRERIRFAKAKSPISIGRSLTCDVVVDDAYVAPVHAILEITPSGTVRVSDAGSRNGIVVAGVRHRSASGVALVDECLQLGRSTIRVRTAEGALEPERIDGPPVASRRLRPTVWAAVFGTAVGTHVVYENWLGAPQDLVMAVVTGFATLAALLAGWIAAWSLLTRVLRTEWRFAEHAAIAFGVMALHEFVGEALNLGFFVSGRRVPGWALPCLGLLVLGLVFALHLAQASSLARRKALAAALIAPLCLGGGFFWVANQLDRDGFVRAEAGLRLYPPALRLSVAEPVGEFFTRAAALRSKADKRSGETKDAED